MRASDIERGGVYGIKSSPNYGYIKVFCVLKPKERLCYKSFTGTYRTDINTNNVIIVRCLHSTVLNFDFGIVRDLLPREIIKETP